MSNGTQEHNPNRNRNRNRNKNRNRQQAAPQGKQRPLSQHQSFVSRKGPKKLSLWQKFLKLLGLYKEPKRPARKEEKTGSRTRNETNTKTRTEKQAPRTNTRDARTSVEPRAPREPREARAPRERREPTLGHVESCRLYIGNLSYEASESDIEELFKGIGPVRSVEIVYNKHTHRSKGYGFVEMLRIDEAKRAVEVLHDQHFMGRQMVVSGAKAKNAEEAEAASIAREQKENVPISSPTPVAASIASEAIVETPVANTPEVVAEVTPAVALPHEQVELPLEAARSNEGIVEEVHSLAAEQKKENFV